MDIIFLRGLKVEAVIGIWEWERKVRQTIAIDLEFATRAHDAAVTDRIEDAVNYHDVAQRLIRFTEESEFRLVETLAEALAKIMIGEFGVQWVRLSVGKPGAVRGAQEVGVIIERRPGDFDA
jgi:7,8-dihydroneopterin aldolase/epimerase/oxygenase